MRYCSLSCYIEKSALADPIFTPPEVIRNLLLVIYQDHRRIISCLTSLFIVSSSILCQLRHFIVLSDVFPGGDWKLRYPTSIPRDLLSVTNH